MSRRSRSVPRSLLGAIVAAVVLAAVAQAFLAPASRASRLVQQEQFVEGQALYQQSCASCHGADLSGTDNGPPLAGAGAAAVDFYLSTGRMPLANPKMQPTRHRPAFTPDQIRALVAYVTSVGGEGIPIPAVDPSAGSLPLGQQVYEANCGACHGAAATGDSIGGGQIAPALDQATALQIAEAVRIGPGAMPKFGETTIDQEDLDAVARYLLELREMGNPGGLGLTRTGPVAEGFVGVVVGLGLLLLVIRLAGTKT
jgi:quinol---cytochrome-c reductase cytochrome c subunit